MFKTKLSGKGKVLRKLLPHWSCLSFLGRVNIYSKLFINIDIVKNFNTFDIFLPVRKVSRFISCHGYN